MPDETPLRVLFVEDWENDAILVTAALKRAGFAVQARRVTTAAEMEAALRGAPWDVVIADYSLPHFDALQALALLQGSGLDLPFIVVSGSIDEVHAVAALRAGAHDFITKGNLARLVPAIERERREAEERRQRRAAQAQLREQEASFRLLFESNPLPMWVYDTATLAFLEVNRSAVAHYGYSRDEFLAMTIADIRPPEDIPALLGHIQAERPDFRPREKHWRHRLKDGQLIDVEITSHALTFNGRAAVLVVAHDVTDRKRAEEALAHSERRYRALIEHSADAITLFDRDGHILYRAPSNTAITGYGDTERLGQPVLDTVHPDYVETLRQCLAGVLKQPGSPAMIQYRNRHKDGTWRWLEATFTNLLHEPGVYAIVGNYRDITENKRAEAQLRLQSSALEASANAIVITDADGRIVWVNPAFTRLTGYSAEEAIGQTPRLLKSGRQPPEYYQELWNMIRAGQIWHGEIINRKKDGSLYTEEMTVTPLRGADGHITHFIDIKQDVTERKLAEAQIQRQLDRLAALRAIDLAISSSLDVRLTLDVFLAQVIEQLGVDAANVLLLETSDQSLAYAAGRGFRSSSFKQARLRLGEGRAGRAALERRIVSETGPIQSQPPSTRTGLLGRDNFVSYFGVPLIAKGQVLGVLELFHRTPLQPAPEWLEFLEALAGQAAIAVENASLFEGLHRSHQDLTHAYDATIEGWSRALDLRDKETEGHSQRVTELTLRLAQALHLDQTELTQVRRGALLHDMGKIGIPDYILLKPGPLTDDEWAVMRQHPTYAYELLSPIAFLRPALDIPYCHHEKWDGSGYPRGLRGEQIPLAARLFAVVDVWDALRSDRPYRPAWATDRVLAHIQSLSGSHFDPRAVEVFMQMVG